MKQCIHSRPGYAFLLMVLIVGVIAAATATSLMLLGWAAEQNGFLLERSAQAEEYAKSCIEQTFRVLRLDPSYAGGETRTFPKGSCVIHPVVADGVNDRRVCVEGVSGSSIRRFQVSIEELFPRLAISTYEEVPTFTLCP